MQNVLLLHTHIQGLAYSYHHPPTPPTHEKKSTAKRHRQDSADTGQLPMMHCKFNVSSSVVLHQSQAISGLACSTQSKTIPTGLFPLFSHFYLWAKCEFHMFVNCSLYLWDTLHWGQKKGRAKKALFTSYNIIVMEGVCAVLETETAWYEADLLRSSTWNNSRYVGMLWVSRSMETPKVSTHMAPYGSCNLEGLDYLYSSQYWMNWQLFCKVNSFIS